MTLQYCEECGKNIDLDVDAEHEHFGFGRCFIEKTKLKTLKDIKIQEDKEIERIDKNIECGFNISKESVKVEAIKWVKHYVGSAKELTLPQAVLKDTFSRFFNITDADLKEDLKDD